MTDSEQATKAYRGNCHCGAFVFELSAPDIKSASTCNCSICFKKGYTWVFPRDPVNFVKGDVGTLAEYTFGPKATKHRFCPTCGTAVTAFNASFPEHMRTAINGRCLQGLDTSKLEINTYDGAKLDPQYDPPKFTGTEPIAEVEGGKVYHGSCHCGDVKIAVKVPMLDSSYTDAIKQCNCSICQRNAYIWIYPKAEQVSIEGEENMTYYRMGSKVWQKGFCKTCGVQLVNKRVPFTDEELAALPEEYRQRRGPYELTPLTLRVLNNFDISAIKPEQIEMSDGQNKWGPDYVNP